MAELLVLELGALHKGVDDFRGSLPAGVQFVHPGVQSAFIRLAAQDDFITAGHVGLDFLVRGLGLFGLHIRNVHGAGLDAVGLAEIAEFRGTAEAVDDRLQGLARIQFSYPVCLAGRIGRPVQHGLVEDFHRVGVADLLVCEFGAADELVNDLRGSLPAGIQFVVPGLQSAFVRIPAQDDLVAAGDVGFDLLIGARIPLAAQGGGSGGVDVIVTESQLAGFLTVKKPGVFSE